MAEGREATGGIDLKVEWERMHPVDKLRVLENLVLFPMFLDRNGVGSASVLCEERELLGSGDKQIERKEVYCSVQMGTDEGAVTLTANFGLGYLVNQREKLKVAHELGFPMKAEDMRKGLENVLLERLGLVCEYRPGDPERDVSPSLRIDMGNQRAVVVFMGNEEYQSPHLLFNVNSNLPLKEQVGKFVQLADALLTAISDLDPSAKIQVFEDARERLMKDFENTIENRYKEIGEEKIKKYLKRALPLKKILDANQTAFSRKLAQLEEDRQRFLDDSAEPEFKGKEFPYVAMARFDFAHQQYLSPHESTEDTMSLHRVMDDLGLVLKERIIRRHYANLVEVEGENGQKRYELLTANPKMVEWKSGFWRTARMSAGSTHNDIRDTFNHRESEGARYNLVQNPSFTDADRRGIIFETESGKLYAVWGISQAYVFRSGTVGLKEAEFVDEGLSNQLFDDMSKRYNMVILSGKYSTELLEKIIWEEFTNLAAIRTVQRSKAPLTVRNLLRSHVNIRAGLPVDEEDLQ